MDYIYQVEALKDDFEELGENFRLTQKELKSVTRQHETLKRDHNELQQKLELHVLQSEQKSTADEEEKSRLQMSISQLEEELEKHRNLLEDSEKARQELLGKQVPTTADDVEMARETNKLTREYHYKLKMCEQENTVLQTAVNRLENQVTRCKESLKEAEAVEKEIRTEKRKLLRELREAQSKVEELEASNSHLQKRLDRLRSRNLLSGTTGAAPSGDTSTSAILNDN